MKDCPICNGLLILAGTLGTRQHYRCRACGAWWSHVRKSRKSCTLAPMRLDRIEPYQIFPFNKSGPAYINHERV